MLAIKGIYDGVEFKPLEPIPVNKKYIVAITFVEPIESDQSKLLDFFNIEEEYFPELISEIIHERAEFMKRKQDNKLEMQT